MIRKENEIVEVIRISMDDIVEICDVGGNLVAKRIRVVGSVFKWTANNSKDQKICDDWCRGSTAGALAALLEERRAGDIKGHQDCTDFSKF